MKLLQNMMLLLDLQLQQQHQNLVRAYQIQFRCILGDIYTISVNLAGLPGISVPCGTDSKGLPIGMQIIGDCFKENNIIRAAYAYEQSRDYERCKVAKNRD